MTVSDWPYIFIALYQNDEVMYVQFLYGTFYVTSVTVDVTFITLDVTSVTGSFFLCNAIRVKCYQHYCVCHYCPACRTTLIATRFWVVMICPIIKCLTVLEFSFILFDLCLFITIFNFILNYVPIVTFWIFTYHKIWILLIIFCFIWNYWIIYFLTCLEVFWSVVS